MPEPCAAAGSAAGTPAALAAVDSVAPGSVVTSGVVASAAPEASEAGISAEVTFVVANLVAAPADLVRAVLIAAPVFTAASLPVDLARADSVPAVSANTGLGSRPLARVAWAAVDLARDFDKSAFAVRLAPRG